MRNLNQQTLAPADATQTQTTVEIESAQLYRTSLMAVFSNAGCTGSIALQGSNDLSSPTHWVSVATANVTAGGVVMIPATELSYQYIRGKFTPTAGAGTVSFFINAQGF